MSLTLTPLLKYYSKSLNLFGILGLALTILGICTFIFNAQYLQSKHKLLESSLKELSVSTNTLDKKLATQSNRAHSMHFIKKDDFFNILEFIQNQASLNSVGYESINYQSSDMNEVGLTKYELDLPFSATYVDLKKFLYAILQPYPNTVVLTDISLYRNSAQDDKLDGSMQIALYFRN